MREVLLMWRNPRMVGLTILVTIIFTAVLLPFKQLAVLPGFSSIRPANVLPVIFGLMFGPAAAWGSMFGNILGDILGGTWSDGSWFGAIANFFTAFIVYRLWGNLGAISTGLEPDMQTGDQFPEYVVIAITAGCITASIVGWGHEIVRLLPFSIIGGTIVFNNSLAELFLGPPLLYLLYRPVKERGWLYHQILSEGSLPTSHPRQRQAAIALVVLSVGWLVGGMGFSVLVDGVSLRSVFEFHTITASGSQAQIIGGTLMFGLVCLSSGYAGEQLSNLDTTGMENGGGAVDVFADESPQSQLESRSRLMFVRENVEVLAIIGLGVTLAALYGTKVLVSVVSTTRSLDIALLQLAIGLVLPVGLIGTALWLNRTDYPRDRIWTITLWTFGGLGVVTMLSVWQFSYIFLGVSITGNVMEGFLLNVQAGAAGGLLVGVFDARAASASEALDEAQEQYSTLGEKTHDGVAIIQDGVFKFVNPQMATLCGRNESALLDRPVEDVVAPEYRETVRNRYERRTAGESPPDQYEIELLTPDDTRRYVDFQVKRIQFERRPAVLATAKDITDWKELERQLREQRDNVELLNQLLRHDIMNEMDLVMKIARRFDETADEGDRAYPRQLLSSGERILDILDVSQDLMDAVSEVHLDRETIQLAPLLERELVAVTEQWPKAEITMSRPIPDVDVLAHETLASVIRNLLSNAVRHNDKDVPEVVVEVEDHDHRVTVEISDNGPGISDDRKEAIFRPDVGTGNTPTSGLGLYLVESLVSRSSGSIRVEDNDPDGSSFFLDLEKEPTE